MNPKFEVPLYEVVDPDILNRCVVITNMRCFTIYEQIVNSIASFFGPVQQLCFLHEPKLKFTRRCLVLMRNEEDATRILNAKSFLIYDRKVEFSKYEGPQHGDLKRGQFKLQAKIKRRLYDPRKQYEMLEEACMSDYYSIEFMYDTEEKGNKPGTFGLRFDEQEHMDKAMLALIELDFQVTIVAKIEEADMTKPENHPSKRRKGRKSKGASS